MFACSLLLISCSICLMALIKVLIMQMWWPLYLAYGWCLSLFHANHFKKVHSKLEIVPKYWWLIYSSLSRNWILNKLLFDLILPVAKLYTKTLKRMNFQYVIVNIVWWYTLDVIYWEISIFLELSVAYVSEQAGLSSIDFSKNYWLKAPNPKTKGQRVNSINFKIWSITYI